MRGGAFPESIITQETPFISKSPFDVFLVCLRHIYVNYCCTAANYCKIYFVYVVHKTIFWLYCLLVPVCTDVSEGQTSCKNGNIPDIKQFLECHVCVCQSLNWPCCKHTRKGHLWDLNGFLLFHTRFVLNPG